MTTENAFSTTLTSENQNWSGYTLRVKIPASALTKPTETQTFTNITLNSGTSESQTIDSVYIGHASGSYSFASTPVQLTVNSQGSFVIPSNSSVTTDNSSFVYDGASDILISAYFNGGSSSDQMRYGTHTGCSLFFKQANDASTVSATGYEGSGYNPNVVALVSQIQMDGYTEEEEPEDPPVSDTFELFGAIRDAGSGWYIVNDSEHAPKNLTGISTVNASSTSGYVRITFPTCTKVGMVSATPDETYAQSGINAGASVGMSYFDLYFGHNGTAISPNSAASSTGNFMIYGKMWI